MLQALFDALGEGEQARLLIEKQGDSLMVTVIPLVSGGGDSGESQDDNVKQLRAALAMPLRLKATPAALDESLCDELREYGQLRSKLKGHNQTLESMREAERVAKQQADKAKAKAKTQKADKAQSEESDTSATSGESAQGSKQTAPPAQTQSSAGEPATAKESGKSGGGGGVKPAPAPTNDNPPSLF